MVMMLVVVMLGGAAMMAGVMAVRFVRLDTEALSHPAAPVRSLRRVL
jgi:hypothetical protein